MRRRRCGADANVTIDEARLVELASSLAWESYRARFNRVFEVEAEGYCEGAFCPLPLRD